MASKKFDAEFCFKGRIVSTYFILIDKICGKETQTGTNITIIVKDYLDKQTGKINAYIHLYYILLTFCQPQSKLNALYHVKLFTFKILHEIFFHTNAI